MKEQDIFGNIKFIKPVKGKKSEWVDLATKNALDGLFNQAAQYQKYAQSLDFLKRNLKIACLLYTSPSPRDRSLSRMPSSA